MKGALSIHLGNILQFELSIEQVKVVALLRQHPWAPQSLGGFTRNVTGTFIEVFFGANTLPPL